MSRFSKVIMTFFVVGVLTTISGSFFGVILIGIGILLYIYKKNNINSETNYKPTSSSVHSPLKVRIICSACNQTNLVLADKVELAKCGKCKVKLLPNVTPKSSYDSNLKFLVKVTGVTQPGKQELIEKMNSNSKVSLRRYPNNEYDEYAIGVFLLNTNSQIGWVDKNYSCKISPLIDQGKSYQVYIHSIFNASNSSLNSGIQIYIDFNESCTPTTPIITYAKKKRNNSQTYYNKSSNYDDDYSYDDDPFDCSEEDLDDWIEYHLNR